MGEKIIVRFIDDKELDKFIHAPEVIKLLGENAKYKLIKQDKYEAFIVGIDDRFYLPFKYVGKRYSKKFIESQILKKIKECIDVQVKEGKTVLINFKFNQKTAKITFVEEIDLARTLNKNLISIGFDEYRISPSTFKYTKICLNCGKLGHTQYSCRNETVCINCAGPHKHEECKSNAYKCVNCGGQHKTTSNECNKTKIKRNAIRRERKEKLLNKWNIKNNVMENCKTPQKVIRDLIDEEKRKLRRKINKKLMMEMSKEGYTSFVLNNHNKYERFIIKTNNKIDYKKTLNNYLNDCKTLANSKYCSKKHRRNNKKDKTLVIAFINIRSIINKPIQNQVRERGVEF